MNDTSKKTENDEYDEADSRADAVAAFCLIFIAACTAAYFAYQ